MTLSVLRKTIYDFLIANIYMIIFYVVLDDKKVKGLQLGESAYKKKIRKEVYFKCVPLQHPKEGS